MEITSKELYKARPQVMGFVAILIIFAHLVVISEPPFILAIHRFSQIGVDIFLFLSGIGCYQSINKRTIGEFYWRRFERVIPSYILVLIGYGAFLYFNKNIGFLTYLKTNSFFIFPFAGITVHWFIFAILTLYLLTPLFYKIVGQFSFWVIFAGTIIISSQVWFLPFNIPNNVYLLNELFITRIPIYMLGMNYGKKFEKRNKILVENLYIKLIAIIIIIFCNNYFNTINVMSILHYLSIPATVYITFSLVSLFNKIKIFSLESLGNSSLESYLVNEKIIEILITYTTMDLLQVNLCTIVLTILLAILLKKIINLIIQKS